MNAQKKSQKYAALFFTSLLLCLGTFGTSGCSSVEQKQDTAEDYYKKAEEFEKADRYEEAIRRYQDLKNKFPYSKLATESELAVADIYFKQESFTEAAVSYATFRELHPRHPRIDYVIYQTGLSYFHQLPSTVDRDLSFSADAIKLFDELQSLYPQSKYVEEVRVKRAEIIRKLAGKEEYIARFYFKQQKWESSLGRYEGLLAKYPGSGFDPAALKNAMICAKNLEQKDKVIKYKKELLSKYPDSAEAKSIQKED
jgi:outer membrane protein assembly factor BamD